GRHKIVKLPVASPQTEGSVTVSSITVSDDGLVEGESKIEYRGTFEFLGRARMDAAPPSFVVQQLMAAYQQAGEGTLTSVEPLDFERPFEVLTRFDLGRLLEIPGTGA